MRGVNADPHALLDLCFALLDGARILPYYFYMCDMIPNAEHWRVSVAEAQQLQHDIMGYLPGYATPRIVCDVPFVGKRWVHMLAEYDREHGISYWTKNYRTSIEATDPEALSPHVRVLRPDRHPARGRPEVVARSTVASTDRARPPRWPRRPGGRRRSRPTDSPTPERQPRWSVERLDAGRAIGAWSSASSRRRAERRDRAPHGSAGVARERAGPARPRSMSRATATTVGATAR